MFTILGAYGFIGSHLAAKLREDGYDCFCPKRGETIPDTNLGNVLYCIGLTADFRTRPMETVEAHVGYLLDVLTRYKFDSFLYLSSTRVYGSQGGTAKEDGIIRVEPLKFDDIYNISKVMGEAVCFASPAPNVRVVRLSNVYGYDTKSENFIFTLIRDALTAKKIVLNTPLGSSKDHVNVKDVVEVLPQIALHGKRKLYNVAHGKNTTVGQIVGELKRITRCSIETSKNTKQVCFPTIDTSYVRKEFGFKSSCILEDMDSLVTRYLVAEYERRAEVRA